MLCELTQHALKTKTKIELRLYDVFFNFSDLFKFYISVLPECM